MKLDNQQVFFALARAGLWEKEARLASYDKIDFQGVYRLAEEQAVLGLVTAGLEQIVDVKAPQVEVLQFVGSTLQLEQTNLTMNVLVAQLIEMLCKNDINALLVKGQGIAQCYERPLWRSSGDIDLLLDSNNYEKAKAYLMTKADSIQPEYTSESHLGMVIEDFVVELHGTMHTRMSKRIDSFIDGVQEEIFKKQKVRKWNNSVTEVCLPAPDEDVIFVFTHIIKHFFLEGIGLRHICDWCRLLWTYKDSLNYGLLESRIQKMGLMTEWRAFAAFAVKYLGMPTDAMPLYSADARWERKAERICSYVMEVGNFGHKQRRDYSGMSYLWRKLVSFWGKLSVILRHFQVFPIDSIVFFGGVLRSGLYAAVRGE